jgi:hypothetical protein
MTTWTDIPNASVIAGAPPRGSVWTAMRDNIIALSEGAAGAPRILRGALKTTTNSVSGTLSAGSRVTISLDAWSFFPDIRGGATGAFAVEAVNAASANADTPRFSLACNSGTSIAYTVAWRSLAA